MALNNLFTALKQGDGLLKDLDVYLLSRSAEDTSRANVTNSPSSALQCTRRNYYQRQGVGKDPIDARTRLIFDNGDGMHERYQRYFRKMGVLLMDEVPLLHEEKEIQGHTDGFLRRKAKPGAKKSTQILELKSINSRGFSALKEAKEDHRAQAQVYIYCAEERRKELRATYANKFRFKVSEKKRRAYFEQFHLHLINEETGDREKLEKKLDQCLKADSILFDTELPIDTAHILYENKDTQERKEFVIKMDLDLMGQVLSKFEDANEAWAEQELPERECKSKAEGRFCPYLSHCFPN